jgi:hypothetical protein
MLVLHPCPQYTKAALYTYQWGVAGQHITRGKFRLDGAMKLLAIWAAYSTDIQASKTAAV